MILLSLLASMCAFVMPGIKATRDDNNTVTVTYTNLYGPYVVLFQNGFDTMRDNTGTIIIENAPKSLRVKVCTPGPKQDICTPQVVV